jgi:DNA-directed RNA polymerase subunit M/transcription elongation factor TFIIS
VGQQLPPEQTASSMCPKCGTEMVITRITPVLFGGAFEELSLACKTCGHATKIRIERS